jgi:hypothetical protein
MKLLFWKLYRVTEDGVSGRHREVLKNGHVADHLT